MNEKLAHKQGENKRYDCTKIVDFVHEYNRMCDVYNRECFTCPLDKHCSHITTYRGNVITLNADTTKVASLIVQNWSDAHPEKTKRERPALTEKDITVLKALQVMGFHWIAKDKNDVISFAYIGKPIKYCEDGVWGNLTPYDVNYDFSFLSWEDEEPTNIDWLLGED